MCGPGYLSMLRLGRSGKEGGGDERDEKKRKQKKKIVFEAARAGEASSRGQGAGDVPEPSYDTDRKSPACAHQHDTTTPVVMYSSWYLYIRSTW